mmetsp:Transcript_58157/g.160767  ORF Transcript_58157/g.160767 Transcript_58157/m.160767 type:complete len:367 (+) Transcript_58157:57-1157(+)
MQVSLSNPAQHHGLWRLLPTRIGLGHGTVHAATPGRWPQRTSVCGGNNGRRCQQGLRFSGPCFTPRYWKPPFISRHRLSTLPGHSTPHLNLDLYIHGTGLLRRAVVLRAACAAEDGSGQGATQEGCQEEDSPRAGRGSSVARVPAVRVVGKIGAQGHCWVEGALVKASAGQGTARDGHADREAEVMVGRVVRSARGEHRAAERQGEEHLKSKARAPGPRELILEAEGLACRREGTEASEDRAEALDGRVVRGVRRRDLPAAGEEHGQSDRRVEEAPGHCAKGVDLNCQDQPDGNRRHAALPGNADADGEDQEKRAHKLCQQHLAQEGLPHNLPACTDDLTHPAVPGVHALITRHGCSCRSHDDTGH